MSTRALHVVRPGQGIDVAGAEAAVRQLLVALGEDPSGEHLRETPRRVAVAYEELLTSRRGTRL